MQRGLILTGGTVRNNVALAERAERAGFDSVLSVEFFNQHAFAVLGERDVVAHGSPGEDQSALHGPLQTLESLIRNI